MMKTQVVITVCQRSGTTLMHLILDSHDGIYSNDEDSFDYFEINTYMEMSARDLHQKAWSGREI